MKKLVTGIILAIAILVVSSNAFANWHCGPLPIEIKDPAPNPYGTDWTAIR